ncbi:rab9 effector protein with kelch motifs isoform X2 [Cricetulus griseus]|uniref:Rab9 effector protein with kelch motifs n=1 Tax=Cricetulus griseus TaxID=10029 RepID=A0A9J7JWJ8_CRIGR|nr:rab9 effector protein with kelch motifs isoform X2 [Cricetulus griseus]XP_027279518.1 rab9 effector protein with kelch motifs isoform X2 [Cricetulus griseus]ERE71180.1 rab9 effector protein with kelch motif-like protein [Cricetulus griseus]
MKQLPVLEPGDKPRKATWYTLTRPGDKPCPRVGHSCSYLPPAGDAKRGKVFIVGGANPNQSFSDVHIMDLGTQQWDTVTTEGLLPRYEHASFIPSCTPHSIWVFGGADQSGNRNCLQVLDPETRTWTTPEVSSPPPSPRTFHTSAAAIGNQLYVFGGGERGDQPVQDVKLHVFDANTLMWSQPETHGSPPSARHGHVMVATGTKLFVHGGLSGDKFFDDLHCIDIKKQHWTSLQFDTFLPPGRLDHSMCVIPWPVMSTSENEDSDSVILKCEAEKGDAADIQVAQGGGLPEESQTNMLLCFVFGGMNTEGEIYDDCFVTVVD